FRVDRRPDAQRVDHRELVGMAIRRELRPSRIHRQPADRGDLSRSLFRVGRRAAATRAARGSRRVSGDRLVGDADDPVLAWDLADTRHHLGTVPIVVSDVPVTRQRLILVAMCVALAAGLAYLRDPPWAERVTSGLGQWEEDPPGTRFRWTVGRA